jgi:hypothetical protein
MHMSEVRGPIVILLALSMIGCTTERRAPVGSNQQAFSSSLKPSDQGPFSLPPSSEKIRPLPTAAEAATRREGGRRGAQAMAPKVIRPLEAFAAGADPGREPPVAPAANHAVVERYRQFAAALKAAAPGWADLSPEERESKRQELKRSIIEQP